jgi:OmpA family protein
MEMFSPRASTGLLAACLIPACLVLSGCVVAPPVGPSVVAVPGNGKSMAAFQQDDATCQQYAAQRTGNLAPGEAANQSAFSSMALGTGLGAAVGALFGAAAGSAGVGAAIGAGSGLLLGSAVGAGNAQASAGAVQQRYDTSYVQCMYSRGDTVPDQMAYAQSRGYAPNQSYAYPTYPGYYYYPYGAYPAYPAYPAY